jgi:hypothetical protein
MAELPWYCHIREHEHSTEWEAAACMQLFELWQDAMAQLLDYVRADEVEWAVNQALPGELEEDVNG